MENQNCAELVQELVAHPVQFWDEGRSYALLQTFLYGGALETLLPLLSHDVIIVQRVAIFIISELGSAAQDLIDDVIPLLYSEDRYIQYYAMEALAVCSHDEQASKYALVIHMLESDDEILRGLAMRLTSRVDISQIKAAGSSLIATVSSWDAHLLGIRTLAAGDRINPTIIVGMIGSDEPLIRRYGAIAACRLASGPPGLMSAVKASHDADLQRFHDSQ